MLLNKTPPDHIITVVMNAPITAETEILIKGTSVKMSEKRNHGLPTSTMAAPSQHVITSILGWHLNTRPGNAI